MPTQLQLEGPDLESLLARVKAEHGTGARIVRAERVRTGGIAGFFAKQRFEVSVEVSDDPAGGSADLAAGPADVPTSLLELADQVSDTEHQSGLTLHSGGEAPAAPRPATPDAAPTGSAFAAVLARLEAGTPTSPTPAAPNLAVPQPVHALTAPAQDEAVDPDRVPAREALPPELVALERSSGQVSTEGDSFAALLANLDATAGAPAAARRSTPAAAPVPQFLEPAPITVQIPEAHSHDRTAPASTGLLPVHLPFGRTPGHGTLHGQLARLGLPAHLLPADTASGEYQTLLRSLEALPQAPSVANRGGNVLAIVGPLPQAVEAARALALDLGLPVESAVVVATSHRGLTDVAERQVLRDLEKAQKQRAGWRRRRTLTIVAIDAPMTAVGATQARAYLSVLAPTSTWGAVEATRKTHDVGAFARAVGGLDALVLSAVEETSDPAAVLELGIPVARLGAQPATATAWAALLAGRLAA